ncbi:MAG: isocitrate lyase/phosphoenolpyruvate mutase family protein [Phenylobacterium sp.]|uniref:isocitrate lyase/PEP mutase family protein n=1 Tax=Phenylobacterium sp. TaxID=1871053 RepID=UPI003BB5B596
MITQSSKARTLRQLHERPGAFAIPNPFDLGSMRILEGLGFEALATTSAGLAFSLGRNDGGATQAEVLAHCRELSASSCLPISADLGIGFGESPESAAETVRTAAATGIVGCSLEDTPHRGKGANFSFNLAVERIAAAADAARRLDHDFILTARCEHFAYGGSNLDYVLKCLTAFEEAGADVLYAPGVRDPETIRTICAAVNKPVNVLVGFRGFSPSLLELEHLGVKRVSVGEMFARTAYGAILRSANILKETGRANHFGEEARSPNLEKRFFQ